jgi:hypothetical protein
MSAITTKNGRLNRTSPAFKADIIFIPTFLEDMELQKGRQRLEGGGGGVRILRRDYPKPKLVGEITTARDHFQLPT